MLDWLIMLPFGISAMGIAFVEAKNARGGIEISRKTRAFGIYSMFGGFLYLTVFIGMHMIKLNLS